MATPYGKRKAREFAIKNNIWERFIPSINAKKRKIVELDLDGNFIKEWESIQDAMKAKNNYHIGMVVKHKRNKACERIWLYKEEWEEMNKEKMNENNSELANKDN